MLSRLLLVALCVLSLLITSGCAPRYRTKVEAFFDDLGRSIRQTTRRLTGDDNDSNRVAKTVQSRSGLVLRVLQSSLKPVSVHPGDQVQVVLRYSIAGTPAQGVQLHEKSILLHDGKELAVLKEEASGKENGEWENTLSFVVPSSAKPGKYTVKLLISAQGQSRSVQRSFTVQ